MTTSGGLEPGARLGRYECLRRLARGGMAELYLARVIAPASFQKIVALKRVLPPLARDPQFVDMFLREARIAAALDHPNLVQVTDFGHDAGQYFYAMEYVHGRDLRSVLGACARGPAIPLGCALSVVAGCAAGLHYAHDKVGPDGSLLGLVHRDITPSNVLVSYDGFVKVTDFGIAKASQTVATKSGVLKGKIGYMSPEQCRGDPVDRRSDVFSLGILLYETTTGSRCFFADSDFMVLNKAESARYTPPSQVVANYPAGLEQIISRALARRPEDRYPTAQDLQTAIEMFAVERGVRLSPVALSRLMRDTFGDPLDPMSELGNPGRTRIGSHPLRAAAVELRESTASQPGARRLLPIAGAVALAFTAGWAIATAEGPPAVPQSVPTESSTPLDATPTPAAIDRVIPHQAIAAPDQAPIETQPAAEAAAPTPKPTSARPRRRPRRRAKGGGRKPADEAKYEIDFDDIVPPSMKK